MLKHQYEALLETWFAGSKNKIIQLLTFLFYLYFKRSCLNAWNTYFLFLNKKIFFSWLITSIWSFRVSVTFYNLPTKINLKWTNLLIVGYYICQLFSTVLQHFLQCWSLCLCRWSLLTLKIDHMLNQKNIVIHPILLKRTVKLWSVIRISNLNTFLF